MLSFHCPIDGPDAIAVQVLAKHGDDGWVVMCFNEKEAKGNLPEFEQRCNGWLSTFEFI